MTTALNCKKGNDIMTTTNINITMNVNDTATKPHTGGKPKKAVICFNDNLTFNSVAEASRHYGISVGNISAACLGRTKTTKGKSFAYIDNDGNPIKPVFASTTEAKRTKEVIVQKEAIMTAEGKRDGGNCEPCMCITDGLCFTSMTDAAEHYSITVNQISYACKVPGRKAAGREFCSTKDIRLHLNRFSDAINKANAYDILVEKERLRKELIADVDKCQDDVYAIEMKLCEAKQALEKAQHALATFN